MHRRQNAADLLRTRRIELRQQRRQGGVDLHRREAGIVHVQDDPLGIFHETNAVLGHVGSSGRGDARIGKDDTAAAVGSLDAPEQRAFVLRVRRFICERNGARRNPDEMATAQRHGAARAIVRSKRAKCRLCSGAARSSAARRLRSMTRPGFVPEGHSCGGRDK
jgi:hypothetical protein